jgi:3-dehydro-L-gulonate 2-dehydrogenase
MKRVPFKELHQILKTILLKHQFSEADADLSARLFAETSLDGFASHGLNRFPTYIRGIERGYIKTGNSPELLQKTGNIERWDGNLGPGNLNAFFGIGRAIEIASEQGIGCVALRNTNHWLRGGSYGWQAAGANCIGICWTNTKPNLPPWGGSEATIGNNPFVLAVPRKNGHIVLDMALSLYSYGKLESYRLKGEKLPYTAGYDQNGNLTSDPGEIERTERLLPIGFWKGSGLSIILDIIAALLSGGDAVYQIGQRDHEFGLSQVFIAINTRQNKNVDSNQIINRIIDYAKSAQTESPDQRIYYPGEQTLLRRKENLKLGVPVDETYWQQVLNMPG